MQVRAQSTHTFIQVKSDFNGFNLCYAQAALELPILTNKEASHRHARHIQSHSLQWEDSLLQDVNTASLWLQDMREAPQKKEKRTVPPSCLTAALMAQEELAEIK